MLLGEGLRDDEDFGGKPIARKGEGERERDRVVTGNRALAAETSDDVQVSSVDEDGSLGCGSDGEDAADVVISIGTGEELREMVVGERVIGAKEDGCGASEWEVEGADVSMISSSDNNEHVEEAAGSRLNTSELSRGFPVVSGSDDGGGPGSGEPFMAVVV